MDNIKQIIANVIGQMASHKIQSRFYVHEVWKRSLGKQDLDHTQLIGEKEGVLTVVVDSPARLYQMNTKRQTILLKVQKECPEIKNIQFKIGQVDE